MLRSAGRALTAAEVKEALRAEGMSKADVDKAWPGLQKRLKAHDHVAVEGKAYRWAAPVDESPEAISVEEALELLVKGDLSAPGRAALAEAIRSALITPPSTPAPDVEEAARQRQTEIDSIRELAELASEVEELVVNETEPDVMIRLIRAWVKRIGLDPVGRAGEQTRFDRKVHRPIGSPIRDGATVFVVRPGYVWKRPDQDVLIGKAVVEE